ncbi:MAG: hypothetical protein IT229_08535 [Flavobacteriales bacterium]|nr:hypothetical protein [Flavobacteriales bacterium]
MEFLSERVSLDKREGVTSVVISPRLSRGNEALLLAWVLAWTCCGAYVIYELFQMPSGEQRSFTLAFMAFWTYFEVRMVRVLLWRTKGFEKWRLKDGTLTIKDEILGYGRANDYFVENIQKLGLIEMDRTSWKWQLNDSFWVMGGERLGFEHLGKKIVFGKGLTDAEAKQVLGTLQEALKKARKQAAAQ